MLDGEEKMGEERKKIGEPTQNVQFEKERERKNYFFYFSHQYP